jgi:hypothetical protein
MLELLISIMMTLNIHFTVIDKQVQISSEDMKILQSSELFQRSGISPLEDITITDSIDPTSTSTNNK